MLNFSDTLIVAPDVFANNRISLAFRDNIRFSSITACFTDECAKSAGVLYETLTDSNYGASYSPDKTAFNYAKKDEIIDGKLFAGNFFDWLRLHVSLLVSWQRYIFNILIWKATKW
jgi:hypothetical protein